MSELAERKGAEYCTAILGLYVFTGEDATSVFKGKGKVGPLKKLHNHQTGDISVMLYVGYVIFLKKRNNVGRSKSSHNINQTDSFVVSRRR